MSTLKISLFLAGVFAFGCADKSDDSANTTVEQQHELAPTCEEAEAACADGYACVDVDGDLACENIDECADGLDDCAEGYT